MTARILVVHDDTYVAHQIRYALQCAKYDVPSPAASVDEAVSLAGTVQPDLVLLDITSKQVKNPLVLARYIISKLNIPVLCLTEFEEPDFLEQWQAPESIEFLFKPYEEWELLSSVREAIENHATRQKRMH